ncbi:MAG: hypothetical protein JWN30_1893 [Bacilli bacterium]|nr:hypothetical protein [Bacilli bacterium]
MKLSDAELHFQISQDVMRINNLFIRHGNSERLAGAYGLSQQQWSLLTVLYQAEAGMTMTELGKNLLVTKANMTGMIDRLERDGYVKRTADPTDRRVTNVIITDKGIDFMNAIDRPRQLFLDEVFAGFSKQDKEALVSALGQLYQSLDTV